MTKRPTLTTIISTSVALAAVGVGLLLSPVAKQCGIFQPITRLHPSVIGIIPAVTPKDQWRYTFDEFNAIDLRGQHALITGANSGLGFSVAEHLSERGAAVTLGCRNPQKCFQACDAIRTSKNYSGAPITPLLMDVSSLKSVQSAAQTFLLHNDQLDMLYLNAGTLSAGTNNDGTLPLSKDGIEMVFATNVLGHHLLYKLLLPALQNATSMARVIHTSSLASFESYSYGVATDLRTLNGERSSAYHSLKVYGHSKLAQIVWTKAATRQLGEDSNIYINAMNPGAVRTSLMNKNPYFPQWLTNIKSWVEKRLIWSVDEGALTLLYLGAGTGEIREKDIRGKYFHPQAVEVVNSKAGNESLQDKFWSFCEELVKDFL